MADFYSWSEKDLRRRLLKSIRRDVGIPGNGTSDYVTLINRIRNHMNTMRQNGKLWFFKYSSYNKLRGVVTEKGNSFFVDIKSTDYFPSLEDGRAPSVHKGSEKGGWSDPNNPTSRLRQWIKKNKLTLKPDYHNPMYWTKGHGDKAVHRPIMRDKTEEEKRRSLAFIIARKIHNKGTKLYAERRHRDVYTSIIERWQRHETDVLYNMLEAYGFAIINTLVQGKVDNKNSLRNTLNIE